MAPAPGPFHQVSLLHQRAQSAGSPVASAPEQARYPVPEYTAVSSPAVELYSPSPSLSANVPESSVTTSFPSEVHAPSPIEFHPSATTAYSSQAAAARFAPSPAEAFYAGYHAGLRAAAAATAAAAAPGEAAAPAIAALGIAAAPAVASSGAPLAAPAAQTKVHAVRHSVRAAGPAMAQAPLAQAPQERLKLQPYGQYGYYRAYGTGHYVLFSAGQSYAPGPIVREYPNEALAPEYPARGVVPVQ